MTIKILKAKKIKNPKGEILKFIDRKSSVYKGFGEVYFNNIRKNKKSNWIYHKKNQCIFLSVNGKIKFDIVEKNKKKISITISKKNNKILIIPPRKWFRFSSGTLDSTIVNLVNFKHDDKEVIKK